MLYKPPPPDPIRWPASLKYFWIAVGVPVCLLWGTALVVRLAPPYRQLPDFVQEWTSGRNFIAGQPIYQELQHSVPRHLGIEFHHFIHYNAHPPAANLVTLPFAYLPYETAYLSWNLLSLLALACAIIAITRQRGMKFSPWILLPIVAILLVGNPLAQQVNQGQLNALLLACITGAWVADRKDRQVVAGTCLGLAAAIKLFPAFLFLYFVAQRRWRALAAGIVMFGAINALSGAVFGWDCFSAYAFDVLPSVSGFGDYWSNASIAGFWDRLLHAPSSHVIPLTQAPGLARLLTLASCLVIAAITFWKARGNQSQAERDLGFSLTTIAMLLVSPVTWDHYFLLLMLPLLVLWKDAAPVSRIAQDELSEPHSSRAAKSFISWNAICPFLDVACAQRHRVFLFAIVLLLSMNPAWLWNAAIPGEGELAALHGKTPSVATSMQSLMYLSVPCYILLGLFAYGSTRVGATILRLNRKPKRVAVRLRSELQTANP